MPELSRMIAEIFLRFPALKVFVDRELEMKCAMCDASIPSGRTRFCSDFCLARFKRLTERSRYGHRHRYKCVDCGHELRPGRRRKEP
jgi:hypothetical protein